MTCQLYQKQLSSYLDGELPAARAARIEAHLRVCPHCRGELHAMTGIADHIREAAKGLQVSQDFDQRVLHAVGYLRVTGRSITGRRAPTRLIVLLALVLLALLGAIWRFVVAPPAPAPPLQTEPVAAAITPAPPAGPLPPAAERRR